MPATLARRPPGAAALAFFALFTLCGACSSRTGDEPGSEASPAPADAAEPDGPDLYTVRAEVVEIATSAPGRQLVVHHEAIDDFKGIGGEVWGMDAMTMPFPVAETVDLEGIEVGDRIEMRLEIDLLGDTPQMVTSVRELPAGTELEFREAQPPGG